jgi:hypothetical protein
MAELADEQRLVLLAQCGDREAIEQILLRLRHSLSRYGRGLVGESGCEDVQDMFVKIWRNLKSLEKPDLLRPWVYRIASRACFAPLGGGNVGRSGSGTAREPSSEALPQALNENERARKRALLITRLTIYPSVACFVLCILMLLFSANKWLGLTWGIMTLYGLVGAVGINVSTSLAGHTRRILKALAVLYER